MLTAKGIYEIYVSETKRLTGRVIESWEILPHADKAKWEAVAYETNAKDRTAYE